jgi:hypothetical protein
MEVFVYVEGASSDPLLLSTFLDYAIFLIMPTLPHFQHFLIDCLGDLDLPLDLDLPPLKTYFSSLGDDLL